MTKEWRSRENKRRACGEQDWSQKRAEPSPDDEGWDQPLLTFFLCLVASASSPHAGSLGTSKGRLAGECKSTRAAWPERLQLNSIAGRAFRSFNSTSNKRLSTRICGTKFVSEAVWEITLLSIFSLLLIMLLSKWYGVSANQGPFPWYCTILRKKGENSYFFHSLYRKHSEKPTGVSIDWKLLTCTLVQNLFQFSSCIPLS